MQGVYYNEFDPNAAAWLRNLIAARLIPDGDVDERSIADIHHDDLKGYVSAHFFAGIGGWPASLRLAGWPDDRPVWTGSCPCQPFSQAGKQRRFDDPRHLWPEFKRLIDERRPTVLFGEQVAGASQWLRLVRGDLEALEYAVGAMPIEAASAGADHLRDRFWFVADRNDERRRIEQRLRRSEGTRSRNQPDRRRQILDLGDAAGHDERRPWQSGGAGEQGALGGSGAGGGQTEKTDWVIGADGKARRVKSGVRLLAHGVSGRLVVRRTRRGDPEAEETHTYSRVPVLKGFGNAIDLRAASSFIGACMEILVPILIGVLAAVLALAAIMSGAAGVGG